MSYFDNKTILITGGTGSFGQHFVRWLLEYTDFNKLIIFSRDELKQFEMQQSLSHLPKADRLRFFLGDVRDVDRLKIAFKGVNIVIHAAALKQVPAAEYNPFEFIKTNINGAENIVNAAIENDIEKVIALSTDKASSPINLYGATKLCSDKAFIAANHMYQSHRTRFSVVRYGNVVGSRGSIVPYFMKLRAEGAAHLPITDVRMTRFWISLNQAIDMVVDVVENSIGGEMIVSKLPSVRTVDLAKAISPDLAHKIIGIRPGEKIHEEMVATSDALTTVDYKSYYMILPAILPKVMEHYLDNGAKKVSDDFHYRSDTNPEYLTGDALKKSLVECGYGDSL